MSACSRLCSAEGRRATSEVASHQSVTTSRERVELALAHVEPDLVPLDLGGSIVTTMHVDSIYLLRQALGLDPPGTPVKVIDLYQMLGEIAPDLVDALGVDVMGVGRPGNYFGFENKDWKPWTTFGGTPVLVPGGFNTEPDERGDILMYPEGDKSAPPSGRMPKGGFYFDSISRQLPIDESKLDPKDNLEEFSLLTETEVAHIKSSVEAVVARGKAAVVNVGDTTFGGLGFIASGKLKHPRGIRDMQEWLLSLGLRPNYIRQVFDGQCEIALQNFAAVRDAVGNDITVAYITGTDFGGQERPLISPKLYRDLFKPVHKRVNDWIHANTTWKTFMHSDGTMWDFLDDVVEAGFDILNPIQASAARMDPAELKKIYGDRLTFWGGGIDTQHVLPFGTPDEVRAMVKERIRLLGPGGGFVFSTIHNLQSRVPVENIIALYEAVNDYRAYPLA